LPGTRRQSRARWSGVCSWVAATLRCGARLLRRCLVAAAMRACRQLLPLPALTVKKGGAFACGVLIGRDPRPSAKAHAHHLQPAVGAVVAAWSRPAWPRFIDRYAACVVVAPRRVLQSAGPDRREVGRWTIFDTVKADGGFAGRGFAPVTGEASFDSPAGCLRMNFSASATMRKPVPVSSTKKMRPSRALMIGRTGDGC
jgi:hypothetical protein